MRHIQNEEELAEQLVGFFQQFFEVFTELKGKNLYLTGESVSHHTPKSNSNLLIVVQYAGTYVPCT